MQSGNSGLQILHKYSWLRNIVPKSCLASAPGTLGTLGTLKMFYNKPEPAPLSVHLILSLLDWACPDRLEFLSLNMINVQFAFSINFQHRASPGLGDLLEGRERRGMFTCHMTATVRGVVNTDLCLQLPHSLEHSARYSSSPLIHSQDMRHF